MRMPMFPMAFRSKILMSPEGGDGAVGAGGGGEPAPAPAPAPEDNGGGTPPSGGEGGDGDEGLPSGGSLIGDGKPAEGTPSEGTNPAGEGAEPKKEAEPTPTEMTEEEWLAKIAFTEEIGKDDKGNPLAPNAESLKTFAPILREIGLDPEKASKLVTAYAKIEAEQAKAQAEEAQKAEKEAKAALIAKRDELKAQAKKDMTADDLAYANRAMERLGKDDPVFYKMVQTSLLGVHPCFLKLCAMAGRRVADDTIPHPNGVGGGAQRSRAEILFGAEAKQGLVRL